MDTEKHSMSFGDLRESEPLDWPGRQLVEQDNMGDWGGWLSDFEGALKDMLLASDDDCTSLAEKLAEDYISECEAAGYPLPAEFVDTADADAAREADYARVTAEFVAYLRAWRAAIAEWRQRRLRVIDLQDNQSRSPAGGGQPRPDRSHGPEVRRHPRSHL